MKIVNTHHHQNQILLIGQIKLLRTKLSRTKKLILIFIKIDKS